MHHIGPLELVRNDIDAFQFFQMIGEPDKAIRYFKECIEGQDYWIQLHYACWWEVSEGNCFRHL